MANAERKVQEREILIVDDSEHMRRILLASLQPLDVAIYCAATPDEGLLLSQCHEFSLVLTDLYMPRMSGLEFLRRFRSTALNANCHAFMVTAVPPLEITDMDRTTEIAAWILKPINPLHVRVAATRILGLSELGAG